jgi:phospholipid transport system substrate-binding protein
MLFSPARFVRRFAVIGLLTALAAAAAPARADDGTALINSMADTVISALRNRGLDQATREARLRAIYRQNFDTQTITAWVLGRAWQAATPAQREQLSQLYEVYVVRVYASQLYTYSGEQLRILGSQPDVGGGLVVTSLIVDPRTNRTADIKWRLRGSAGAYKVRDVLIENVSMSVTHRREFETVFQQRGNSVDALIHALRAKTGAASLGRAPGTAL